VSQVEHIEFRAQSKPSLMREDHIELHIIIRYCSVLHAELSVRVMSYLIMSYHIIYRKYLCGLLSMSKYVRVFFPQSFVTFLLWAKRMLAIPAYSKEDVPEILRTFVIKTTDCKECMQAFFSPFLSITLPLTFEHRCYKDKVKRKIKIKVQNY